MDEYHLTCLNFVTMVTASRLNMLSLVLRVHGFPIIRHSEIRDLTAGLLSEVCNDVCIEPDLQPVPDNYSMGATANTQDNDRLDIPANKV